MDVKKAVIVQGKKAKEASRILANTSTDIKNKALLNIARKLEESKKKIISINDKDMNAGKKAGFAKSLLNRLELNEKRINSMAKGLREVVQLEDPIGEVIGIKRRPNGLEVGKIRVPLGVIGIIYEARPNVTVDVAGLCLKAGNAVLLRGGKEAFKSNQILTEIIQQSIVEEGLPCESVQLVQTTDRAAVSVMFKMNDYLDVLIPRGGAGLIKRVVQESSVPVIETGVGNCHVYVDSSADIDMALRIVYNAKTDYPAVCNAAETLLIHKDIAEKFLPLIYKKFSENNVELRGCAVSRKIIPDIKKATEDDWYEEYLDLIMAVKIVDSIDDAINHIYKYGSKHSESIVTSNYNDANKFLKEVDAAAVYVNASTRFTDGGEFGLGAEIGISTQKLHARGPMGLKELTSTKFIIRGSGQIRET
ncbi:glutamate-5-semialdehyde dehydrogenase [candidate division WOR-3 bacterium]|nr:glutamate-5-semialdehyde dehydrogenase [candidate division WOR-3 bacterium]